MLTIRMQRTGRKGHANFRVVLQDSRQAPTSGRVVAQLGSYNPHTKELVVDKEKVSFYLSHGAHPSDKVARLLKKDGVKLPAWVNISTDIKRDIKNVEKLRKNRPAGAAEPAPKVDEAPQEPESNQEKEAEAPKEAEESSKENPADTQATEQAEPQEDEKPM